MFNNLLFAVTTRRSTDTYVCQYVLTLQVYGWTCCPSATRCGTWKFQRITNMTDSEVVSVISKKVQPLIRENLIKVSLATENIPI